MSSRTLTQWCGLASMASGVLLLLFFLLNPARDMDNISTSPYVAVHLIGTAAAVLGQFALIGLYTIQRERSGILGLLGLVVPFVALALTGAEVYLDAYVLPLFAAEAPQSVDRLMTAGPLFPVIQITSGLFVLGFILFGLAALRAGVLPRWAALLVIIGSVYGVGRLPLPFAVRTAAVVVFAAGLVWLGYALWSAKGASSAPPPAAA